MAKDAWLTEKEICDQIEANELRYIYGMGEDEVLYREHKISPFYRPDFLLIGYGIDRCLLTPIEVKITATIDSVIQCANYHQALIGACSSYGLGVEIGQPWLIARYFEDKTRPLLGALGWPSFRLSFEGSVIGGAECLFSGLRSSPSGKPRELAHILDTAQEFISGKRKTWRELHMLTKGRDLRSERGGQNAQA